MTEIKFLKELPIRSLNTNKKFIDIKGADIYVDKDANKFAFIEFDNVANKVLFSLYFIVKEYDAFGSFIKEVKFALPTIFSTKGSYITEKPVHLSDDCDGVEVFVTFAEFSSFALINDEVVKRKQFDKEAGVNHYSYPETVSKSSFEKPVEITSSEEIKEPVEETPVKENATESVETVKEETDSETKIDVLSTENAEQINEETKVEEQGNIIKVRKPLFNFVNLIIVIIAIVLVIIEFAVCRGFPY